MSTLNATKPWAPTFTQRATSLAGAVFLTLAMLVGVNTLAEADAPHDALAHAPAVSAQAQAQANAKA